MSLGLDGEKIAALYLRKKKYKIINQNYRCRLGEIDIVAFFNNTVIFCEVKTRRNKEFGEPFESVTKTKQNRLRRLAEYYILNNKNLKDSNFRFDVVSILVNEKNKPSEIFHIENAF
ncbi:MAG: YraN family protein [Actinobacteria bacterium]|nr:YraN family protein [Actinomycetota bacterium]